MGSGRQRAITEPEVSQEWLDGPRFAQWLREHGLEIAVNQLSPNNARYERSWRAGAAVSVWVADRALTELGLSLGEIPDEFWVPNPRGGRGRRTLRHSPAYYKAIRSGVVRRYLRKERTVAQLAKEYRLAESTVRNWIAVQPRREELARNDSNNGAPHRN